MVWNLQTELSLDLSPPAASLDLLPRFSVVGNWNSDDLSKLHDFIDGLENELAKIQAFKRELPLSFVLLNDAIGKLKEEAKKHEERSKLVEIAGIKLGKNDHRDEKKSWMSSAQLWSPRNEEDDRRLERRAFLSFREGSGLELDDDDDTPGLSLVPPGLNSPVTVEPGGQAGPIFYSTAAKSQNKPPYHQTARKQRRCWSPELHRRFVDALEKLGGSPVATPKQIRELMQVDGLTNDEVKSHLQKYRLHVRKISSSGMSNRSSNDVSTGSDHDQIELGCSKGDEIDRTRSPEGPLHLARSGKCNSTGMEEDEDEEKSDGHSWKVGPAA